MKTLIITVAIIVSCFTAKAQKCTCYYHDSKVMPEKLGVCFTNSKLSDFRGGNRAAVTYNIDSINYIKRDTIEINRFFLSAIAVNGKLFSMTYEIVFNNGQTFINADYENNGKGWEAKKCIGDENYIIKKCITALNANSSLTKK